MQPVQRVALAAATDLAAFLGGEAAAPRPRVAQRARPLPPMESLAPEQRQALRQLASAVVELVLSLAGKRLALGEAETAVRREVHKRLMANPVLERAVAARMEAALPGLMNLERLAALAGEGMNAPALAALEPGEALVGSSPAFAKVLEDLALVAGTDFPVLITGESGTGKELMARRLHRLSPRREGPLVVVNCAALPPNLLESELFGHEKGAFTGAHEARPGYVRSAAGGTLFLDEIGEAPAEVQVRLLRVLESRAVTPVGGGRELPVDFRLVAATHRDLGAAAERGEFNQALLYRIQVVPLDLPPLRARQGDLDPLIDHFLAQACSLTGRRVSLSSEARELMKAYAWPGNVRELINLVQRLVVLCRGEEITSASLPPHLCGGQGDEARWLKALADVEGIAEARKAPLAGVLARWQGRELANQDLRSELGCSDSTAKNILAALAAAGLAQASGQRGGRRYCLEEPPGA
ncbi:MAG: sigma-54 dependent transcriptional regulator [Desulfarculaceae bacterium]|nr:sigma-54 dependent transcriptional regulator [Desulfarculaceae bacterium]